MPKKPEQQPVDISPETAPDMMALPEAVREYVRRHNKIVQDKLATGQPVTAKDLEFIGKVKTWVALPPDLKAKCPSIGDTEIPEEFKRATIDDNREAFKRHLDPRQWRILKHMASLQAPRGQEVAWINGLFQFPGKGKILCDQTHGLDFSCDERLTELPGNLTVWADLNVNNCSGLKGLPEHLEVRKSINAQNCENLETVGDKVRVGDNIDFRYCPKLWKLPDDLTMPLFKNLNVSKCTSLTRLPRDLRVKNLTLYGCTGLDSLPDSLTVIDNIIVTGCKERVKKDAQRLGAKVIDYENGHQVRFGKPYGE